MTENNLVGRRCIGSVRCSTKRQKKESFPQQAAWLRDFADENQMVYVGEIQEALGVSQTEKRPDIDYLLRRAARDKDYDTLLVLDLSRLTRGGFKHGLEVYFAFDKVGVTICSILDGLIDTEAKLKEAIRRFEEAQAQSKASTLNMLRGRIKSRRDGRCAYTFQIPYGIDRLYTTAEGEPLHIIRNLADGRQLQLDPSGKTTLREFEPNEDGTWKHYVKQKDEHITLIPGDPERVAVLRRMFRRKFVDGWGQMKIARELNDEGIVSPKGHRWAAPTVQKMLQNSVYFGVGIGNRMSKALFYKAGRTTPQSVVRDTGNRKCKQDRRPLEEYRPETEWFEQICPQLENLLELDPTTTELVRRWQGEHRRRLAAQLPLKPGGSRFPESDFFLSGILWSKQGNHKMSGTRTKNSQGYVHRYYRVTQGRVCPKSHDVLAKMIPAGMLEEAALGVLRDATSTFDDIDRAVRTVVAEEATALTADAQNVKSLKAQRQSVDEQIDFYVNQMAFLGSEGVRAKTDPLRRKLLDLSRRIEAAERQSEASSLDIADIADAVKEKCRKVFTSLDGLSRQQIRNLVKSLVTKVVVDLETREAVMEVQMPLWAIGTGRNVIDDVCVVDTNSRTGCDDANVGLLIPLASYVCAAQRVNRQFCMACQRTRQIPATAMPAPASVLIAA